MDSGISSYRSRVYKLLEWNANAEITLQKLYCLLSFSFKKLQVHKSNTKYWNEMQMLCFLPRQKHWFLKRTPNLYWHVANGLPYNKCVCEEGLRLCVTLYRCSVCFIEGTSQFILQFYSQAKHDHLSQGERFAVYFWFCSVIYIFYIFKEWYKQRN